MKMDYHLESKLAGIANKFESLELELLKVSKDVWDIIATEYNGHPLTNIDEFIADVKAEKVDISNIT